MSPEASPPPRSAIRGTATSDHTVLCPRRSATRRRWRATGDRRSRRPRSPQANPGPGGGSDQPGAMHIDDEPSRASVPFGFRADPTKSGHPGARRGGSGLARGRGGLGVPVRSVRRCGTARIPDVRGRQARGSRGERQVPVAGNECPGARDRRPAIRHRAAVARDAGERYQGGGDTGGLGCGDTRSGSRASRSRGSGLRCSGCRRGLARFTGSGSPVGVRQRPIGTGARRNQSLRACGRNRGRARAGRRWDGGGRGTHAGPVCS